MDREQNQRVSAWRAEFFEGRGLDKSFSDRLGPRPLAAGYSSLPRSSRPNAG